MALTQSGHIGNFQGQIALHSTSNMIMSEVRLIGCANAGLGNHLQLENTGSKDRVYFSGKR